MTSSTLAARVFSVTVVTVGVLVLIAAAVSSSDSTEPVYFTVCLALAVLSAGSRFGLPAFPGTISVGTLFILLGLIDFSFSQAIALAVVTTLAQAFATRRNSLDQNPLLFRLANISIATAVAHQVYQAALAATEADPLWALIPTALTFALMNSFPAAVRRASAGRHSLINMWHECGYWTLPHYVLSAIVAAAISSLNRSFGWNYALLVLPVAYVLYRGAARYLERARTMRAGADVLASRHERTLETLGLAISARFRAAQDELSRTQAYAMWIAEELELREDEREALKIGAVLHDVGTLAVPEQIMCKRGRLTCEEFEKIKVHPVVGASIVERAEFPFPVAEVVRHHHERWDGEGYPDGLRGEQIPIAARVLSIVDCLVALTTERPYRPAISFDRALAFIASESSRAFDPTLVNAVLGRARDLRETTSDEKPSAQPSAAASPSDFLSPISDAHRESQEIYELAQEMGRSLSLNDTLNTFCRRLRSVIPYDAVVFYVLRDDRLVPECSAGSLKRPPKTLTLDSPVCGQVIRTGQHIMNADPTPDLGVAAASGLRSALAGSLDGADGCLGVLSIYRNKPEAFSKNDLRLFLGVKRILAAAVENAIRYIAAETSATTDHLTGLPNARSLFQRLDVELARANRGESLLAVMVCDLDGFKAVNDRYGHLSGNQVLKAVAKVLQQNCREYDYVARMGGDEFVVLLPGLPESAVDSRARHVGIAVAEAAEEACPGCGVTLSSGKARYPIDGSDAESLLASADSMMYESKQRRKAHPAGFDFDWISTDAH